MRNTRFLTFILCSPLSLPLALAACADDGAADDDGGIDMLDTDGMDDGFDDAGDGDGDGDVDCVAGEIGCECAPGGACDAGLMCDLGMCIPSGEGDGDGDGDGGAEQDCGTLSVVYRDFQPTHVDFGCAYVGSRDWPGLVEDAIGGDGKPVYSTMPEARPWDHQGTAQQITSGGSFADWYNTTPGVNMEVTGELALTDMGNGVYSFSSDAFYPLTGKGLGNETTPDGEGNTYPNQNGNFTTEIHTKFVYEAGQVFTFIGDDDVWVYIDGDLVVDIGGLHPKVESSIDLDTLGLTAGETYTLDVFHAERCASGSNFRIDTTIGCLQPVPPAG